MCGICGRVGTNDPAVIRRMTEKLNHRGPDAASVNVNHDDQVEFGHTRLEIRDLGKKGEQPFETEDSVIVFNGEIYNCPPDMTECGFIDRCHNIGELEGMFAFAIWHNISKGLCIARDRFGMIPVYYSVVDGGFSFSSEIGSLLEDPRVSRELDQDAIELYLTLNYIPAPRTIYKHIKILEPGYSLYWKDDKIEFHKYYEIEPKSDSLGGLLISSVKDHMVSDVPIGAYLSGGLDSSIITGIMQRFHSSSIDTYTIGYKDMPMYDETRYAKAVSKHQGTNYNEIMLDSSDVRDIFPEILSKMDQPFADSSAIPSYILAREVSKHTKVVLSGDGADELFGGYRMYQSLKYESLLPFVPNILVNICKNLPEGRDNWFTDKIRQANKFFSLKRLTPVERYCKMREIFSVIERHLLLNNSKYNHLYLNEKRDDYYEQDVLYHDVEGLLHNDMLYKANYFSMQHGLEVRTPFLDHRVVEHAFSMPNSEKFNGKKCLVDEFSHLLPDIVKNRPKKGFEVPISAWFKNELKDFVASELNRKTVEKTEILNWGMVKGLIFDHWEGYKDNSWKIWNLIVLTNWLNRR